MVHPDYQADKLKLKEYMKETAMIPIMNPNMEVRTVSAQYKAIVDNIMRENAHWKLAQEIRPSQARRRTRRVDWLLCELDHRRVLLAQRLERYDLAQSLLHADEASVLSSGHCS